MILKGTEKFALDAGNVEIGIDLIDYAKYLVDHGMLLDTDFNQEAHMNMPDGAKIKAEVFCKAMSVEEFYHCAEWAWEQMRAMDENSKDVRIRMHGNEGVQ